MKIRPISDRIVVSRLEPRAKSAGGIIIPDSAREKPQEGKVVAVGPGRLRKRGKRKKIAVSEGDHVLFASYAGSDVDLAGKEYVILSEEDIIGIVS